MNLLDGLVEFWTFNDTLVGLRGTTLTSANGLSYFTDNGKVGSAWQFATNDLNRLLRVNTSPLDVRDSFTVAFWYQKTATGNVSPDLIEITVNGTRLLRIRDVQTFLFRVIQIDLENNSAKTKYLAKNTDWHFVCCSYQQPESKLAVTIDFSTNIFSAIARPTSVANGFGVQNSAFTYDSKIDAIGLWSRALSENETAALYANGAGWEPSAQTIKQHLIVSASGIIQPVGSSIVVPGWV